MSRRRYSGRRHSRTRDIGHERALQHIEEAKELSQELGGTDQDVKAYFFGLSKRQLTQILDAYEGEFGRSPREYAEKTFPNWRSGRTHMSGLVASRLYSLLPPRMPIESKYGLVKSLWSHVAPSSHKVMLIGPDVEEVLILSKVRQYFAEAVSSHNIPTAMERRFAWLSGGDVDVQQQLLNYLRGLEKKTVVDLAENQLPILVKQIRERADVTRRLSHTLKVGKHELQLIFDPAATRLQLMDREPSRRRYGSEDDGWSHDWIWVIVIFGVLYGAYYLFGQ